MKPLIGITTGEVRNLERPWSPITYGQSHTYVDAIVRAGGLPILLPLVSDNDVIEQTYSKLDGLLFAGGNDIDPQLYGQKPYKQTVDISKLRDGIEVQLMRMALDDKKPVLAICRGMQLLNVACGGTLYQDIMTDLKGVSDHEISSHHKSHVYMAHRLNIKPNSNLAAIINSDTIDANSHHHQAVHELGSNLIVTARSEDNVIEAVEGNDNSFVIGVQCHPESLEIAEPKWNLVFESFVKSACN